ncbi:MAG: hypothetical protein PHH68_07355 [Candidatus Omnitrophica bacterium]|nr:hypothetical protein [Candidatus Omnitrophota bacterium]
MERIEEIVAMAYKEWKSGQKQDTGCHPDEDAFVNFLDGSMPEEDRSLFRTHAVKCPRCADILAASLKLKAVEEKAPTPQFLERMKAFILRNINADNLDITLGFKDSLLRLFYTNGDVLIGRELVPAAVLRGRQVKDFKDELDIFKDFGELVAEVKIVNKAAGVFEMAIRVKEKQTRKPAKDIRIALLKNGLELESFHMDSGKVRFEHIKAGRYKVEISGVSGKLAEIGLEIQAERV